MWLGFGFEDEDDDLVDCWTGNAKRRMTKKRTIRNARAVAAKKATTRRAKKAATRKVGQGAKGSAAKRVRRDRRPAAKKNPASKRARLSVKAKTRRRNAFGLDRFIGRKPRVTAETYRRAGEQRRARAYTKAGVPKKLMPLYTSTEWKDLQQMDPGFVRKVMRSLDSRNPFTGSRFKFHGAFTKKSAAVAKEQSRPGSFILPRFLAGREHRYVVMSPIKNPRRPGRRNPDLASDRAAETYAMFHGRGPKETVTVEEYAPKDMAALGDMVCLILARAGDNGITWPKAERPILAAEPGSEQLHIVGGDQLLDNATLRKFGVDTGVDVVDLGEVQQVEYYTQKDFDNFQPIIYYHEFGEEDAKQNPRNVRRPRLLYSRRYKKLMLAGGAYRIKKDGILN